MFKNKNNALERSQDFHSQRANRDYGGNRTNAVSCDYHSIVYSWQSREGKIMTKKHRNNLYSSLMRQNHLID